MRNTTFGIEVEFQSTQPNRVIAENMTSVLREHGIEVASEHYNHITRSNWKLITDASIDNGRELVSPPLKYNAEGLEEIHKVLNALNMEENQVRVSVACGVHVHMKWTDMTVNWVKNVIRRYAKFESIIDTFFPNSRRDNNNQYCRSFKSHGDRKLNDILSDDNTSLDDMARTTTRYNKVNTQSLNRYGTMEFRQHAGSTDPVKISNWVHFIAGFVKASNPERVSDNAGMDSEKIVSYLRKNKSQLFGEIRELYEMFGWSFTHKSKGDWVIKNSNGNEVRTIYYQDLKRQWYLPNTCPRGKAKPDSAGNVLSAEFLRMFVSDIGTENLNSTEDSVWSDLAESTKAWFERRIVELNANTGAIR